MIRVLFAVFLISLLFMLVLVAVAGIESTPLVEPARRLSHQDIARIKLLLRQHDPRHLKKQELRTLFLTERDLNLLLEYANPHLLKASGRVDMQPEAMKVRLTVKLPDNPLGGYLNITTDLSDVDGRIHIKRFTLGGLSLPVWLLEPLLFQGHRVMLARFDEYRTAVDAISSYQFQDDRLVVVYQLDPNLLERLKQSGKVFLLPESETHRMLAYHEELARISGQYVSRRISLGKFLTPLFQLAMHIIVLMCICEYFLIFFHTTVNEEF